ncbi:organic cation transporter protein-like [Glandiceps talaboti]
MLQFDDVLRYLVGEFGPYQKLMVALILTVGIPSALQVISPVFLNAKTDHWCTIPNVEEISKQVCLSNFTGSCSELVKNLTLPRETTNVGCGMVSTFSQCYRYNITQDFISYYVNGNMNAYVNSTNKIGCDHGWEYDRSQYKSTVMQEFDLVCDERFYLNAVATTIFMAGYFVGSLLFGYVVDRFGRMFGLMVSLTGLIIFGTTVAFAPNYIAFVMIRFLAAIFAYGTYLSGFVMATEVVGPSYRKVAGMVYHFGFGIGYMLLALYAYFVRYWWKLQLLMTIPLVAIYSLWWVIPESPRWLLSMKRNEDAEEIIRKYAKYNKVSLPDDIFDESWKPKTGNGQQVNKYEDRKYGVTDLFRLPNTRKKTLILFYCWVVITLVYYGLSFNTSNLGGDDYVNCFLAGAVEIPAYGLGILLLDAKRFGRRWSMFYTLVVAGVCCIAAAFVPPCGDLVWFGITLTMISKFSITSSFGMVYVYTAELYPTPVRCLGVGLCSMCARVGGMLAPQLLLMGELWTKLPPFVFGSASIIAGFVTLSLPETRGINLLETLEEGEQFGKKQEREETTSSCLAGGEVRRVKLVVTDDIAMDSI